MTTPPESEPMLTFKLSDETEFRCSVCQNPIASVGNGRFVIVGLPDLITAFRNHVARYHAKEHVSEAAARMGRVNATSVQDRLRAANEGRHSRSDLLQFCDQSAGWMRLKARLAGAEFAFLTRSSATGWTTDSEQGKLSTVHIDFSDILGLAFDFKGRLYVLENTTGNPFPTPGTGKILRVDGKHKYTEIATGLSLPTAMTFGPDGNLYVSN